MRVPLVQLTTIYTPSFFPFVLRGKTRYYCEEVTSRQLARIRLSLYARLMDLGTEPTAIHEIVYFQNLLVARRMAEEAWIQVTLEDDHYLTFRYTCRNLRNTMVLSISALGFALPLAIFASAQFPHYLVPPAIMWGVGLLAHSLSVSFRFSDLFEKVIRPVFPEAL
ncbi:MAG: hypothetical protein JNM27_21390 [Leptospirales bacterium]|nr:hypothetical protein [Leptospirales bacterium]